MVCSNEKLYKHVFHGGYCKTCIMSTEIIEDWNRLEFPDKVKKTTRLIPPEAEITGRGGSRRPTDSTDIHPVAFSVYRRPALS